MNQNRINCQKCTHYYVTWDPRFPHGCRAMNFKSKEMPYIQVARNTGHECLLFTPKTPDRKKDGNRGGGFSQTV